MNAISVLFLGMIVVVGSVLVLRLHAFLALLFGALIVAALTSPETILQYEFQVASASIESFERETQTVTFESRDENSIVDGWYVLLRRDLETAKFEQSGRILLEIDEVARSRSEAKVVGRRGDLEIRPEDRLIHSARLRAIGEVAGQSIGIRVGEGFGQSCLKIGILIAMAAIIGKCLLDSGGAERIVVAARRLMGDRQAPLAFMASGFIVGIPVFFDTVFYLLMPLGKALRMRTGRNYLLYVLSIICGASMAHSLVPPTPGPLFVANEMGIDIGTMMLAGGIVGLFASIAGYAYALWANRRWDIPLRPSAELTADELDSMAQRDESTLPPLWFSLLPIVLPLILIAGGPALKLALDSDKLRGDSSAVQWAESFFTTFGSKNMALTIAAVVSLLLLCFQTRISRQEMATRIQHALAGGGFIILITAAGGAFGHVLRQTGIATELQELLPSAQTGLLLLAFAFTAVVRIAQGSATVAMITAVGIIAPLAAATTLAFHPVYLALAIGCGSKPLPWMNDSGFWVVSRMSGMTESETLRSHSVMLTIMGFAGLAATLIGARFFPFV